MNRAFVTVVVLLIVGCATAAAPADPIDVLTKKLNSEPLWPNGEAPIISLSSNATPKEVMASAVKMWGFDSGPIKTYQIREVRKVQLNAMTNCSAALIESDLGKKILLFRYEGERVGWWTRFFDVPEHAEPSAPANGASPRR